MLPGPCIDGARQREMSTEACCLSCRAGEGQPSLDPGGEGPAIAPLAPGDPLTLRCSPARGDAGHEESLEGTAARCQGPPPCWGRVGRAMAARACKPGSSGARQVFSPHEFFPALAGRAGAVEYLLKRRGRGLPSYRALQTSPLPGACLPALCPPPKKRGKQRPDQGLQGGTSPGFGPAPPACSPGLAGVPLPAPGTLGWSPHPSRLSPPRKDPPR